MSSDVTTPIVTTYALKTQDTSIAKLHLAMLMISFEKKYTLASDIFWSTVTAVG